MANVSHQAVLNAFQARYDFASAKIILNDVLSKSGIGEKKDYTDGDVLKFGETLNNMGERGYQSIIETLSGGAPKAAPAADAKADAKAEEKKDDKADAKADAKADDKKDDKKDDKADAKADAKADDKKDDKKDDKADDKKAASKGKKK
ncbi:MAG: hypothetical protein KC561_00180 [Myxococcales bacterium]|nr:hypothetical protein [Myxococcales bacterium]